QAEGTVDFSRLDPPPDERDELDEPLRDISEGCLPAGAVGDFTTVLSVLEEFTDARENCCVSPGGR
ncbi:MAG: hypothetical protein ACKON9_09180, partial [Planctomycetaceae bacterium]